jgi:hypothetical protein
LGDHANPARDVSPGTPSMARRTAWASIGRTDPVEQLADEFGEDT